MVSRTGQDDLNHLLLKQLECPVCLDTCMPPIRMCVRSHIVCSECAKNLKECATCRQPMAVERNWFAEDICSKVKFACKHVNNGCRKAFKLSNLKNHLPDCDYKNYDCLIGGKLVNGVWQNVCKWKGPECELFDHVGKSHDPSFCIKRAQVTSFISAMPINGPWLPSVSLVSAYGRLFWKIACFLSHSIEIEFIVLFVGSKEMSSRFEYKVKIGHGMGQLSFYSHSIPSSMGECSSETLKIGIGMRKFCSQPDGKLKFTVKILKK